MRKRTEGPVRSGKTVNTEGGKTNRDSVRDGGFSFAWGLVPPTVSEKSYFIEAWLQDWKGKMRGQRWERRITKKLAKLMRTGDYPVRGGQGAGQRVTNEKD